MADKKINKNNNGNKKPTDKEEMFCREYIIEFNGSQSAINAGYSERSARQLAYKMLTKDYIQDRIQELIECRKIQQSEDFQSVRDCAIEIRERCLGMTVKTDRKGETLDGELEFDATNAIKANDQLAKLDGLYIEKHQNIDGDLDYDRYNKLKKEMKAEREANKVN